MLKTALCLKSNILLWEENSNFTISIFEMIHLLQNACNNYISIEKTKLFES